MPTIRSQITVNTPSGHGSTGTKIRKYSNTKLSTGSDITYTSNPSNNGDTFTINTAGLYYMRVTDGYSGGQADIGFSVNSSQLTTSIGNITDANRVAISATQTGGVFGCVSALQILAANDVIRVHDNGNPDSVSASAEFSITKVGN